MWHLIKHRPSITSKHSLLLLRPSVNNLHSGRLSCHSLGSPLRGSAAKQYSPPFEFRPQTILQGAPLPISKSYDSAWDWLWLVVVLIGTWGFFRNVFSQIWSFGKSMPQHSNVALILFCLLYLFGKCPHVLLFFGGIQLWLCFIHDFLLFWHPSFFW